MDLNKQVAQEKQQVLDFLYQKLPGEFKVFEQIDNLLSLDKFGEAVELLRKNKEIIAKLRVTIDQMKKTEKLVKEQQIHESEIRELKQRLEKHLAEVRPWKRSSISEAIGLDDVVITNLVEWGFTHKEVKLLLLIKHGRLT